MTTVERYLREFFLDADDFARHCAVAPGELAGLITRELVPAPAYRISDGEMRSFVFGNLPAPGAPAGHWFNPHAASSVRRALQALAEHGGEDAAREALQSNFRRGYRAALEAAHRNEGPLPGFSRDDGGFDEGAFDSEFPSLWQHYLQGTFSLCVARPVDEAHIVAKEVTQARLGQMTDGGVRRDYSEDDAAKVRHLIARYVELSMPFSPIEYPRSSRKRLVEDVLARLPPAAVA